MDTAYYVLRITLYVSNAMNDENIKMRDVRSSFERQCEDATVIEFAMAGWSVPSGGHLQGIQRMDIDGREYFIVSGSSDSAAYFIVVGKTSRGYGILQRKVICGEPYRHAGGIQIIGDYLAVGVEDNLERSKSRVLFFDMSNPEELIRQIKQNNPDYFEYIKSLPDGIRSARRHQNRLNYVFYKSGDYEKLYLTDSEGKVTTEDMATILATIKCEKAEDPIPLPTGYNKADSEVKQVFKKSVEERAAIREVRVTLRPQQRYVLNHLQKLFESTDDQDKRTHIENLKEAIKSSLPPVVLQILNRFRREGVTGDALFKKVKETYFQYRLWKYIEPEEAEGTKIEPLKIVCSMAMLQKAIVPKNRKILYTK